MLSWEEGSEGRRGFLGCIGRTKGDLWGQGGFRALLPICDCSRIVPHSLWNLNGCALRGG